MRVLRTAAVLFMCGMIAACSGGSRSESSIPLGPSSASAPTGFGTLMTGIEGPTAESIFGRCLAASADPVCFTAGSAASSRMVFAGHAGVAPAAVTVRPAATDPAPNPPTNLRSSVFRSGGSSNVSLFWTAPTTGPAPTDYRIEAGSAPGLSDLAAFNTGSTATSFFTTVSGSGTFYVRVRSVAAGGTGDPSNEITLTLISPSLPSAPFMFLPQVNGSTVTLSWGLGFSSPAATSYIIQASSRAGGPPDLANFATGNAGTSLTATNVAPGTYFVRVLAANNAGVGPASNEVTIIVLGTAACTAAPSAPSNLVAIVNGSTVTLGWSPSSTGPASSYVIEAGSASGLANLATADTGTTNGSATFTGVGRGTYFVRVRGKNSCGTSAASNEIVVTVS
ncbi:MAG TPA: fibronectin type III domain-containing protein [Vicinamibacterales bacterium]|nr:fibronectin type III domain-containing protein [Vicinamibacterales bacterium]